MLQRSAGVIALVLVLVAAGASCGRPKKPETSATYLEAEQLLRSAHLQIGFPMTKKIIGIMQFEDEAGKGRPSRYLSESPAFLAQVCQLDNKKCPKVLDDITMALKHHRDCTANLIPYLQECDRRQRQFCSKGVSSDGRNLPDSLVENVELVFSQVGTEMSYEEIEEALKQIVNDLGEIRSIWAVCQPEASYCQRVMGEIKHIAEKYQESRVNLLPYLGNCAQVQAKFCLGS